MSTMNAWDRVTAATNATTAWVRAHPMGAIFIAGLLLGFVLGKVL